MKKLFSFFAILIILFGFVYGAEKVANKEAKRMVVTSVFKNGEFIPKKYACEGEDINPELVITNVPKNAKSIAIICDDPDAPIGTFVHWVIWNIPVDGDSVKIPEGLKKLEKLTEGTMQGYNDFGKIGYNGPCPPRGHGVHHYHFKVYALDTLLDLKGKVKKTDLEKAMKGHIIESAEIVGLYERKY